MSSFELGRLASLASQREAFERFKTVPKYVTFDINCGQVGAKHPLSDVIQESFNQSIRENWEKIYQDTMLNFFVRTE